MSINGVVVTAQIGLAERLPSFEMLLDDIAAFVEGVLGPVLQTPPIIGAFAVMVAPSRPTETDRPLVAQWNERAR